MYTYYEWLANYLKDSAPMLDLVNGYAVTPFHDKECSPENLMSNPDLRGALTLTATLLVNDIEFPSSINTELLSCYDHGLVSIDEIVGEQHGEIVQIH